MNDWEAFQSEVEKDQSFMGGFVGSMGLVLEEFYKCLQVNFYINTKQSGFFSKANV